MPSIVRSERTLLASSVSNPRELRQEVELAAALGAGAEGGHFLVSMGLDAGDAVPPSLSAATGSTSATSKPSLTPSTATWLSVRCSTCDLARDE